MILTYLKGGLGNQLFQYAYGRAVSIEREDTLVLDTSSFNAQSAHERKNDTKRTYKLNHFNITERIAKPDELPSRIHLVLWKLLRKITGYSNQVSRWRGNLYLNGYFQSEQYFKTVSEQIRKEFTLKDPLSAHAQTIQNGIEFNTKNGATVSIHIRRGDYVHNPITNAFHGICEPEYYERALDILKKKLGSIGASNASATSNLHLYIFSDDINWVKENMRFESARSEKPASITYVSSPLILDYEELALMSSCDHHVIANSSFSWWGAWLNPSKTKVVIAPYRWTLGDPKKYATITPPEWIRI